MADKKPRGRERYLKDYTVDYDEHTGKSKVTYGGKYYTLKFDDDRHFLRMRVSYGVLPGLCAVAFLLAGWSGGEINSVAYVTLPYVISAIPLVFSVIYSAPVWLFGKTVFTNQEYRRSFARLRGLTTALAVIDFCCVAGTVIFCAAKGTADAGAVRMGAALLVSALSALLFLHIQRKCAAAVLLNS